MKAPERATPRDGQEASAPEGWRPGPFDYQRLDVFRVAREALVLGHALVRRLPRGHGKLGD